MRVLWQDARYGLRTLMRSRGYALVMVLTLALGIGATTAIFSLVNSVVLRPLAYPQSQQLVFIGEFISAVADKYPVLPACAGHFLEWRRRCSSFEGLSLVLKNSMTMTGQGEPERWEVLEVSANLFEVLRVPPALGRLFTPADEEGAGNVAVISDGLWRRKYGADRTVLGQTVTLDGRAYTIIGVLPETFRFPNANVWHAPDLETSARPAVFLPKVFTSHEQNALMTDFRFSVIGRLKAGVSRQQVAAELNVIEAQLVKMAGQKDVELRAIVAPLKEVLVRDSRHGLLVILGAIGGLLLIACLNLGILSLARAERRDVESAIRAALGATRARLVRQALVEAALLALAGTVLGIVVAARGLEVLTRIAPADLPRLSEVSVDTAVLLFALGLTGVTALLFGALPAWRAAGARAEHVRQGGRRTATSGSGGVRLRGVLVAAEVGLGVMLLVVAGLLFESFARVIHADLGFQAPTVLAADVSLPPGKAPGPVRFHDQLLEHLTAMPYVDSAALVVDGLPLEGEQSVSSVYVPGDPRPEWEHPVTNRRIVSPGYFQTMGIPLVEGRTFDQTDRLGGTPNQPRRVVVISQRLARALWPRQDVVVGGRVAINDHEWEVIGVVRDVRAHADREAAPVLYYPYWLLDQANATVVVRARGDPLSLATAVRAAVHRVDADVPVSAMRTMREVLEGSLSQRRFQMLLTSTFALCALLLAGLGVYGVVSYLVTRRTREMGIRAALGARAPQLCAMVLRQGMTPVVAGLLLGVAGALAGGRLLQSLLYEVKPYDPWIIAGVVGVMLLTAVLSCYFPARRAARIDPMVALRCE